MIYTLSEIVLPILVAFAVGLGSGWFVWRWRRTPVSYDEWTSMRSRAMIAESENPPPKTMSPENRKLLTDLKAAVDVRDIEIEQLRRTIAGIDSE